MKYKNIVFDFGNVIGKFDGRYILRQFCSSDEDCDLLYPIIYANWGELDKGTIDYEENIEATASLVPEHLRAAVRSFFRGWPEHIAPLTDALDFIDELNRRQIPIYLLSNAPTYFAEWAARTSLPEKFKGVVFSAPLKMAKPDPAIYRYLFDTFALDPEECFFIDDLERNIEAGKKLGMDGIVFTGDIAKVKSILAF